MLLHARRKTTTKPFVVVVESDTYVVELRLLLAAVAAWYKHVVETRVNASHLVWVFVPNLERTNIYVGCIMYHTFPKKNIYKMRQLRQSQAGGTRSRSFIVSTISFVDEDQDKISQYAIMVLL